MTPPFKALVITVLTMALIGLGIKAARAEQDPPSPEQVQNLYVVAVGHTGLGVPEKPPMVYRVSTAALCELVNRKAGCPIRGLQVADAVFYSNDLDFTKPFDSSILLHEFVHYIRYEHKVNGVKEGPPKDKFEQRRRECEAYKVQAEVLGKIHINYLPPAEYCDD